MASSVNFRLFLAQPGGFELLRNQKARGNLVLFLFGVARDAQHFHAILQRLRNRMQHVGRADEHYLRKIVFHIQIMVGEGMIQLGIEHFHQCCGRIASEIHGHLVHFIQHEHRIDGAGLAHHLDDLAGQGADVGAAVAANFSFVAHAAERNADEFAARSASDGHGERGFAHSWRPEEAQNRTLRVFHQLAYREIFQNTILDLFKAVVVFRQNLLGAS